MTPPSSISAFFIVEGKKLEAQAWMLVSSLRHHHPDWGLIAYTTDSYVPKISTATRQMFDDHRVDLRLLPKARKIWNKPYPHGNKLLAANEPRDTDWSLFLDTDLCIPRPIELAVDAPEPRVLMVPEGVPTWGQEENRWERAYAHFGLPVPEEKVQLVRYKKVHYYPYFNAGFICFPERAEGRRFGAEWLVTALDIDHHLRIGEKRPWLDQIALPLTVARIGWRYDVLSDQFNFSTKNRKPEERGDPMVMHYHRDPEFVDWPKGRAELDRLNAYIAAPGPVG